MTPKELKARLKAQKKASKALLVQVREESRAKLDAIPAVQQERRKRRLRRIAASGLLALLLLFIRCDCEGPVPAPEPVVAAKPKEVEKPKPKPPGAPKPKKPPLNAKANPQNRPDFGAGQPPRASWLDEFRIQVSARSPRLSQCFTGTDRPGAIRWTTAVTPSSGTVADHEMEPVGVGGDVTAEQKKCLIEALSKPAYKLTGADAQGLPSRISLVIEF